MTTRESRIMKKNILFNVSLFAILGTIDANASAHMYANTISAHNIAAIQHSVTQTMFSSFAGSMRGTMGGQKLRTQAINAQANENPASTYGRAPMYGRAPLYGEYNDDGTAGRSGGDTVNPDATLNSLWANWQHMGDNAKFDNFDRLDSDADIFMFGVAGGTSEFASGLSKWGLYTGFVNGEQKNNHINIDEQGGFFGIYNGNVFGDLGLYATINGGVLNNSATTTDGTDEYSNFWAGGAINATYDFTLDQTFTIQPGVHLAYTWIRGEEYQSANGDEIKNNALSIFEFAPSIRAIKHIANGWFGSINAKYAIMSTTNNDLTVNNIATSTLETGNFKEYSLSLEKNVANFNFTGTFGRRDGARDGWIGSLTVKYLF